MPLTDAQIERYSRQIILEEVGGDGQEKLLSAKILMIGAGGLGSPAALYLGAAGVGTIGLADGDQVDLSNLQRQIIHHQIDVNRPKAQSAADKIQALNPEVRVVVHPFHVNGDNIRGLIRQYDFVIDGTDNFSAKFLINDACVLEGIPFSHAGILRFQGQLLTIVPGQSACYRCAFPAPPPAGAVPSCSQAGILGSVAGVIGTLQATEALKYILGRGELLTNALLTFNALTMQFRKVNIRRNHDCPLCSACPTITEAKESEASRPAACSLKKGGCP